ncbi:MULTISPECIES: MgtC/SapB family protein [unclassified Nitrosovibrio]|uniref:MgtC/SapB family protein n=1 Tax=unclassified Nitrosovibrio TaxID=2624428 RepID=UPI0008CC659E|nr:MULTISPECIES: MgtC/SapB family protein [unclassified Nitrosovibrio]SEO47302.1 putative Mg2+ transporter-C (MgtC) family protein [Nitrosovibrio sp. Nv6]SOD41630.1 putative Mg2+ transporter-C (MgtC) family protein [Nitrosovibrio sp. Nv4]
MNTDDSLIIVIHLVAALTAGGIIGLERSLHGHPAGFRTHALVCLASSLLMLVTLFQEKWLPSVPIDSIRMDPTRMAQGIMTGIGFLGAGVIFKEGLSVRGLTTAASIWITAGIGILMGIGFFLPGILGTVLTFGVLSLFRLIENKLPSQSYAQYHVSFDRNNVMPENEVRTLVADHGFEIATMSYRVTQAGLFEYRMDIRSTNPGRASALAEVLRTMASVREFRISTTGS